MSVLRPCLVTSGFPAHGTGVAGATNGAQAIGHHLVPATDGSLTAGNARVITGSSMVAAGTGVEPIRTYLPTLLLSVICTGCAVVTVADVAVTVVATTVKVGATVVETTVDVAAAGVKAVAGSSDEKKQ